VKGKFMKKITIYQENTNPIIIYDNDYGDITNEEYDNELTKITTYSNVCKVTIGKSTIIIKPSKLNSILVEHINDSDKEIIDDIEEMSDMNIDNEKIEETLNLENNKDNVDENIDENIDENKLKEDNIDENKLEDIITDINEENIDDN
jgi:hypothetical protein